MRADLYLTRLGHAKSRQAAQKLIADGAVLIDDVLVIKPATEIHEDESHTVRITKTERYVSRGGLKLEHALDVFGVDVRGVCAMDIGASTGGFTDCLLQRGAERVFAIDSGTGQLDPSLEADGRVHSMTGYNARHLSREDFDCLADLVWLTFPLFLKPILFRIFRLS